MGQGQLSSTDFDTTYHGVHGARWRMFLERVAAAGNLVEKGRETLYLGFDVMRT
ncbi:hypothetical protein M404DRAFT_998957 [Pisolithus tinctorius Marx 270]|uniref:Uncharacterized protein n=1 Tax=Pisolithus tinctorius Marx 270 TaxID=870435 RepID=A0A0C3K9S4_PISTI|nr:hypothetical protein M404DRAFT_998957 [Pisolithus tinctorius Marx 270]